jgi:xanthine dehydrogenase accessory factor
MMERGVPRSALERVKAPIGVPIGSHLPDEVALSIMAEVIAVKNGAAGGLKSPA